MTAEENAIRELERKALAELIGDKTAIKKELEIKYVEMPISIEQKKEYNSQGFRVVDAKFAPEGYNVEPEDEKARKAAERKAARAAARAAKETEQEEETEE